MTDSLDLFDAEIAAWFRERYGKPTAVQEAAWPAIAAGTHLLLSAPTGTGKTLAAFLWAIQRLLDGSWETGAVRVLYVSPLRALNNDIRRNLLRPLDELARRFERAGRPFPDIRVQTRSGDTTQSERRRMTVAPPEILITTPESLNLLVTAERSRRTLTGVRTVILDEIHAVAGEKRGVHLLCGVERLALLAGEFQRIALSATIRPPEPVARIVAGARRVFDPAGGVDRIEDRPIEIVRIAGRKEYLLQVRYLPGDDSCSVARAAGAGGSGADSVWERVADELAGRIRDRGSTLIFVNSRRRAEQLTKLINRHADGETIAFAHHGSLAREIRLAVEERLRSGALQAIVATSSLELGIDIGDLDAVYLVETPFSVGSAVQRLGRSGHTVGRASRGVLFASHRRDLLDAIVLSSLVADVDIEPIEPVVAPLDVLAQVIVAMVGVEPWPVDKLYRFFTTCGSYRDLTRSQFDSVVEMLAGRYRETRIRELRPRIHYDRDAGTLVALGGALQAVYSGGGTIPDRGYYRMALAESNATVGELDEEFVWERRVGDTFTLGTQGWEITGIDHQKVSVTPYDGEVTSPPFWRAETISRGFHFASKVAEALESWEARPPSGEVDDERDDGGAGAVGFFAEYVDEESAAAADEFLRRQRAAAGVPHRRRVIIEETTLPGAESIQVFLHTLWGNRVNYPCALALEQLLSAESVVRVQSENDCIHFVFPDLDFDAGPVNMVRDALFRMTRSDPLDLIAERLEQSELFGARFRENAGRALLLPRFGFARRGRTPLWLTRLRAKRLASETQKLGNFPITVETWRACLRDEFELDSLVALLSEIASGEIEVSLVRTRAPSPFAESVVWRSMNRLVYTDDLPDPGGAGRSVDENVLRAAVFGEDLPSLDRVVTREIATKLDRTAPGYAPAPDVELVDWVEERLVMSRSEWEALIAAVVRDHPGDESPPGDSPLPGGGSAPGDGPRPRREAPPGAVADRFVRIVGAAARSGGSESSLIGTPDGVARLLEASGAREAPSVRFESLRLDGRPAAGSVAEARRRIREAGAAPRAEGLIGQWLCSRGPTPVSVVCDFFDCFGIDTLSAIETLVESESVVHGRFYDDSSADEVCDAANLERILRSMRNRRRRGFKPAPCRLLPLFLATWQGLAAGSGRTIEEVVERLEGFPARARAWEEYLFPSRIDDYTPRSLDSLIAGADLEWFGCGERRLFFALSANARLFLEPSDEDSFGSPAVDRGADALFPDRRGRYDFFALHAHSGLTTAELTERLWAAAWSGAVGCDSFEAVRKGVLSSFKPASPADRASVRRTVRRRSFAEWTASRPIVGTWYRRIVEGHSDALETEELDRERVRVLIDRYGVVFRGLLERELPLLSWRRLFRSMRLMELSGEIVGGYFFEGVPGLQFASPEALRVLADGLPTDAVYAINAADPASLCGISHSELRRGLPERLPTTYLVYDGASPAMIVRRNGGAVEFLDRRRLPEYLDVFRLLLDRAFNPLRSVRLYTIDGRDALTSDDAAFFIEYGFRREYKSLTLRGM